MLSKLKNMSLQEPNLDTVDSATVTRDEEENAGLDVYTPECIIFVIDALSSPKTLFATPSEQPLKTLAVSKMAIENFVRSKSLINREHEYGIVALENTRVHTVCALTNDLNQFLLRLNTIKEEPQSEDQKSFDFDLVFNEIFKLLRHLDISNVVTRVIFLYSRFLCVPELSYPLLDHNQFFVDVVFVYGNVESDEEMERLEAVYKSLLSMAKRNAYTFTVTGCVKTLLEHMMKLLAHPLQRRMLLDDADFTINEALIKT